ncbi:MAG: hypothetical protein ACREB7_17975 [Sphingopyxis sp.]|uniref:hypothetical protein n=1 Tax=Sphingopyxis sp. TaxID=1908224 RepID=UPI003D6D4727
MSLEDFSREVMGKPPKNRSMIERWTYTDEDGCSFDQQVWVTRLPFGVGIAAVAALSLVAWANDDPVWRDLVAKLGVLVDLAKGAIG